MLNHERDQFFVKYNLCLEQIRWNYSKILKIGVGQLIWKLVLYHENEQKNYFWVYSVPFDDSDFHSIWLWNNVPTIFRYHMTNRDFIFPEILKNRPKSAKMGENSKNHQIHKFHESLQCWVCAIYWNLFRRISGHVFFVTWS